MWLFYLIFAIPLFLASSVNVTVPLGFVIPLLSRSSVNVTVLLGFVMTLLLGSSVNVTVPLGFVMPLLSGSSVWIWTASSISIRDSLSLLSDDLLSTNQFTAILFSKNPISFHVCYTEWWHLACQSKFSLFFFDFLYVLTLGSYICYWFCTHQPNLLHNNKVASINLNPR